MGFHGAAAEFGEEFASFRSACWPTTSRTTSCPARPTQPLVLRDDFVCIYRDLAPKIRPNAEFCDNTFNDATVVNLCD